MGLVEYTITATGNEFLHSVRYDIGTEIVNYCDTLPVAIRVDLPNRPQKCFVCGDKVQGVVCKTHKSHKSKISTMRSVARCGYRHASSIPVVQGRRRDTNRLRYGVDNPMRNNVIKLKHHETTIKNHGVAFPMQSAAIQARAKTAYIKTLGVDNPFKSVAIKQKIKNTNIRRYGVEYPSQADSIKQKVMNTNIRRLGVDYPSQSSSVRNKIIETSRKRYGVNNPAQSDEIRQKISITKIHNRHGVDKLSSLKGGFMDVVDQKGMTRAFLAYPSISHQLAMKHFIPDRMKRKGSMLQSYFQECLEEELSIVFETDVSGLIKSTQQQIDLVNHDNMISVEVNGIYWHRDTTDRDINKAKIMRDNGYKHIIVDETDVWKNNMPRIIDILRVPKIKIGARKCKIIELTTHDARRFVAEYHLQGYTGASLRYGLVYDNQLVQVMTFSKSRFNKSFEFEISRLCTRGGISVIGGAARLFAHFLSCNPAIRSVISYCDYKYFSGEVYKRIGMEYSHMTSPNYVWMHKKTFDIKTRYQCMKHRLSKLLSDKYDETKTEGQNMRSCGYERIPDLGQLVYTYTR